MIDSVNKMIEKIIIKNISDLKNLITTLGIQTICKETINLMLIFIFYAF